MGLGRRTFAPGEVLTASNVMNYLQDQVVMNFAGTAARGSAIGTAIQEGMVTYQNDSNTMTVYDGSAWKNVFPADASDIASGTLAIARGGTGATTGAGLVPVIPTSVAVNAGSGSFNSTTGLVTFSGGSSTVSLNGVFTTTYTNYVIVVNILASGANNAINTRFRLSGSDYSFASYQVVYVETEAGTTTQAFTSAANTNLPRVARSSQTGGASIVMEVMAPRAATYSRIMATTQDSTYTARSGITYSGNDQFDGISIIAGAAITGDIQVYGRR